MIYLLALFGFLTLLAVTMQKTYRHVPVKELKRRARGGDSMAEALHRAAAYGWGLDFVLWLIIGLSSAGFLVVLNWTVPSWAAFLASVGLVWLCFAFIPKTKAQTISLQVTKFFTPFIVWLVQLVHPLVRNLGKLINKHRPVRLHTGLYEKDDLLELIETQKVVAHNRIDQTELEIAANALKFGEKVVRDVMTPRKMTRFVKQADSIGPILLDELHKSGFSRFPVTGDKSDDIVGTLYLHDLTGRDVKGSAKDFMTKRVFYVQEEQTLWHALNAFLKTKHHLFVVVNNFEEIVGVISIEDILEEIIGKEIVDEFDRFDDLRAVAQMQAKTERQEKQLAEEVVE